MEWLPLPTEPVSLLSGERQYVVLFAPLLPPAIPDLLTPCLSAFELIVGYSLDTYIRTKKPKSKQGFGYEHKILKAKPDRHSRMKAGSKSLYCHNIFFDLILNQHYDTSTHLFETSKIIIHFLK